MSAIVERAARPLRILRRLREAAAAYDASTIAVARRAVLLSRTGWALEEADHAGILDPRLSADHLARHTSIAESFALQDRINPRAMIDLAHDKVLFADWLARRGIPTPATIAVYERTGPGWAADGSLVRGRDEWIDLIAGQERAFVLKPARGHLGYEVRVLRPEDGGVFRDGTGALFSPAEIADVMAASRFDSFVLQERVAGHPDIAALSGSDALQSVRITTLIGSDGRPKVIAPFLRIAAGPGDIDNFRHGTSGNFFAPAHVEDGRLYAGAGPTPDGRGLTAITHHPTTGRAIEGFVVPEWDANVAVALRAAEVSRPLHTVGWDVAPAVDGPRIIEANPRWNPSWPHPDWPEALRALAEAARVSPPSGSPGRRSRRSIR